jgi:acetylornithine deacetylase/succinyl-diaminopimelate desuccinylase-like protein
MQTNANEPVKIRRSGVICAAILLMHSGLAASQGAATSDAASQYRAEIAAIRDNRDVQAAMEYIVAIEPRSRRDLIELTEIPAPPFGEENRARRFADMLFEAGLSDVTIDEVGNAIGRRLGTNGDRVIAYAAHLDTVFPIDTDVTVRFDDEKMYAPGIGDNTRGLVTVLGVLRALQEAEIATEADVLFIGNVGEEGLGDLRGMKHLFRDGAARIDTLIAVDGGESNRIVYGGVGSHRYRVTFRGPGGHSWGAFGLASPHHALGRAISIFVENAPSVTSVGEKTSYNVGRIGGGTSINSIAFESWMEVDMRSGSQDKLDDIDAVLQAAVEQALQEENTARLDGPELTVDVDRVGTRPAAPGDKQSPVVQRAIAATRSFGIQPELRISSTDSNLPLSKGIPAVTMSRGGISGNSHAPDEWWQNADGHIGIQIGLVTLLAEAGITE